VTEQDKPPWLVCGEPVGANRCRLPPHPVGRHDVAPDYLLERYRVARCVAHGTPACPLCSRTKPGGLDDDGSCRGCGIYGVDGVHWDTCPYRVFDPPTEAELHEAPAYVIEQLDRHRHAAIWGSTYTHQCPATSRPCSCRPGERCNPDVQRALGVPPPYGST
jgi:hypothetical protein